MGRIIAVVAVSMLVGGCSSAAATTPDSQKPAHCLAAINYTNHWLRESDETELLMNGTARAVFVLNKIRESGASLETAKADAEALTRAHGNDRERMWSLATECLEEQDRDPRFAAELPALLALVRANPQLAH